MGGAVTSHLQCVGLGLQAGQEDLSMPKMSDSRRKSIQAKQRKATNASKRAAKVVKRQRKSAG
jgi:hypothetical protein